MTATADMLVTLGQLKEAMTTLTPPHPSSPAILHTENSWILTEVVCEADDGWALSFTGTTTGKSSDSIQLRVKADGTATMTSHIVRNTGNASLIGSLLGFDVLTIDSVAMSQNGSIITFDVTDLKHTSSGHRIDGTIMFSVS